MPPMNLNGLRRRIRALPRPETDCPHCRAVAAMADSEWDRQIDSLVKGESVSMGLPDPSPACSHCRTAAAMDESEIDKRLNRLLERVKRQPGA